MKRNSKIKKIREELELGTLKKPEQFFLKEEMIEIVENITGSKPKESKDIPATEFFRKHLKALGYIEQATVDTHPVSANLDFIINSIDGSKKQNLVLPASNNSYKKRKDAGKKRGSTGKRSKYISEVPKIEWIGDEKKTEDYIDNPISLTDGNIPSFIQDIIKQKLEGDTVSSIEIHGDKIYIFFKD